MRGAPSKSKVSLDCPDACGREQVAAAVVLEPLVVDAPRVVVDLAPATVVLVVADLDDELLHAAASSAPASSTTIVATKAPPPRFAMHRRLPAVDGTP